MKRTMKLASRGKRFAAGLIDMIVPMIAQVIAITDGPMSPLCAVADASLTARTEMASFVDSMAAPLSVLNALIVALGLRRKEELSEHFRLMEGIWDEYRVYVGRDRD